MGEMERVPVFFVLLDGRMKLGWRFCDGAGAGRAPSRGRAAAQRVESGSGGGGVVEPGPSARCIITLSAQRP